MMTRIVTLVYCVCCLSLPPAYGEAPVKAEDPLTPKYDTNGNGKIDVEERKGYVRERAKLAQAERKKEAEALAKVPPAVRQLIEPPRWTREKLANYDLNQNGKIDSDERKQERADALKVAQEKFKQADTNGDGKLDAKERAALSPRKP